MRSTVILAVLALVGCSAARKKPPRSVEGPALMPHEAPQRGEADITLRASGEVRGKAHDRGGRFAIAADVGVTRQVTIGVTNTVRVEKLVTAQSMNEDASLEGGFDDLQVRLGWQYARRKELPIRLLLEAWLPTHADLFDAGQPGARGRGSLAITRAFSRNWLWMVPAAGATRAEPRTFEAGLELGWGFVPCNCALVTFRGAVYERYAEVSDRLIGTGRLQAVLRGRYAYYGFEAEAGYRPQGYGQISFAVGLRTAIW